MKLESGMHQVTVGIKCAYWAKFPGSLVVSHADKAIMMMLQTKPKVIITLILFHVAKQEAHRR